ncbi:MAG: helix-turn-helix domain-containing protein [Nitrososphaera sp.]|nr:helix-turn-helix domain-containing protein [Nitrososphaera sp.]
MAQSTSRQIKLTEKERAALEQITRSQTNPHCLVTRARIILLASAQTPHSQIARLLLIDRSSVLYWLDRWIEESSKISQSQDQPDCDHTTLTSMIETTLSDKQRTGAPATFTAEQICQIIAVACEKPSDSNRPISHWSERELASEVTKRNIVESISARSVGRFLKSVGFEAAQG